VVGDFKPQDWEGETTAEAVGRAAAEGAFGVRAEALSKTFTGRPRAMVLTVSGV
jgi:hypothetical protein